MKIFLLCLTLAACSTVNPYLRPIASCAGKSVTPSDANEAFGDLLSQNWVDLAAEGVRLGYDVLACIIADITTQTPGLAPAAGTFKSLHAVEFRAAGVSCNETSKPSPEIGTGPGPSRGTAASLWIGVDRPLMPIGVMIPALAECDRRCGVPMSGLATAEGCKCWDAKRKTSHGVGAWVALR